MGSARPPKTSKRPSRYSLLSPPVGGTHRPRTDELFSILQSLTDVYSLNVPVPGRVAALAGDVAAGLSGTRGPRRLADDVWSVQDEHTLVLKRFVDPEEAGTDTSQTRYHLDARVRDALAGTTPFGARVSRADYFAEATSGSSPVLYLAVESAELERLHGHLVDIFGPLDGVEGPEYVPHVTVARGGSLATAERVAGPLEPVEWTVSELLLWSADDGEVAGHIPLPA